MIPHDCSWLVFGGALSAHTLDSLLNVLTDNGGPPSYGWALDPFETFASEEQFAAMSHERLEWWFDKFKEAQREGVPVAIGLIPFDYDETNVMHLASGALRPLCNILRDSKTPLQVFCPWFVNLMDGGAEGGEVFIDHGDDEHVLPLNADGNVIVVITEGDWFSPSALSQRAKDAVAAGKVAMAPLVMPAGFVPKAMTIPDLESEGVDADELLDA